MTYQPDFYETFRCRASACGHSCCQGWEIDVDEAACARYAALEGTLGERLRAAICRDEDGAHFRLTAEERCPFLQTDGLCEIICRLGEAALCDICALHPRFFVTLESDEIAGLGLSCEAVCDLLLRSEAPLRFIARETGETFSVPALLGRLGLRVPETSLRFDGAPLSAAYLVRMAETEPIDSAWTAESARLRADWKRCPPLPTGARYDRMLQYILLRQLDRLEETGLAPLLAYARESTAYVAAQDALYGARAEHLRRWSEQIEYSTENVEILLS